MQPLPAVVDMETGVHTFFKVLRFVAKHEPVRPDCPPVDGDAGASISISSTFNRVKTVMGVSDSRMNRMCIPDAVVGPLEAFRMVVTSPPIDAEELQRIRDTLLEVLLQVYLREGDDGKAGAPLERIYDLINSQPSESPQEDTIEDSNRSMDTAVELRYASIDRLQTMQEIIPGLWCGSYLPANDKDFLLHHGITHICCCVDVTRFKFPETFMYMKVPVVDNCDAQIAPFFPQTFEFVENALMKSGGGVLVHCGAGISRAPTIVCAYLIRKLKISATAAIALVNSKRPFASPNPAFRRQLREYAQSLNIEHPTAVEEAAIEQEVNQAAIKAVMEANDRSGVG